MKKTLLFNLNLKYISLLFLGIGTSINVSAQEKTKEISSHKKPVTEATQLEKNEVITFPIKAKTTTDPNYEINKQKSLETQKRFDTAPNTVVKDDNYYTESIAELKRRIKEIHDNPESPNVNVDKLGALTDKLSVLEQEYIEYKKSK